MRDFVFLDIETTGIDPSRDHIIEIAALRLTEGKIGAQFETLVNPGTPIPYEITLLTGITDQMVKGAPRFQEVADKVLEFIGNSPIVGHNIPFDISFLKNHHLDIKNAEIDTVELARILLLKESSYALEVLMKKYGLPLQNSHRAMADTQSAVHFFEFLRGKIREIPAEIWEKMERVFEKSGWVGKEAFSRREAFISCQAEPVEASPLPSHFDKLSVTFWDSSIISDFLAGKKILLESPHALPLSALRKHPLVVAYDSFRARDELTARAKQENISICQLKEPNFYISEKKLAQKIAASELRAEETPFFLKMILWSATTETGNMEELSLEREDYGFFDEISDSEGCDRFWLKALEAARKSHIVLIHHCGLARGLAEKIGGGANDRSLIILEASRLEESFTNAFRKRFTETALRAVFNEKAVLAFGLLGIFYTKYLRSEWGATEGTLTIDQNHRESMEWRRALEAFKNLPNHPKKNEIIEVLEGRPDDISWIHSFANELIFESSPVEIAKIFHDAAQNFPSILLQSQALAQGSSFQFIKNILRLGSEWIEQKEIMKPEENRLSLQFPEHFPDPYSEGYFKACSKLFSKIIASSRGRSLFLLSSKKAVSAMYSELLPRIADTKLLAVGHSGGIGKSLALFLGDPENSVLISTNQILPHLAEIEDHIDVIVFQKIPFDHPDNPLLKTRSKQFANGFEEYALPRAIMKFREILVELGRGKNSKTCYLLDSRLKNRDYSHLFTMP